MAHNGEREQAAALGTQIEGDKNLETGILVSRDSERESVSSQVGPQAQSAQFQTAETQIPPTIPNFPNAGPQPQSASMDKMMDTMNNMLNLCG